MSAHSAGRPVRPLPPDLPPAWKDFATALRRCREASGLSLRHVAERAHLSAGQLSKILNGSRLPSTGQLLALLDAVRATESDKQQLVAFHESAVAERDATTPASREPTNLAAMQDDRLSVLLGTLKDDSGLSVRQIADRMASRGIDVGKSSVDRALRNPSLSPQLSIHTAEVLIEELPPEQQGPVRAALFQATGGGRALPSWPLQIGVMPRRSAGFQTRAEAYELASVLADSNEAGTRTAVLWGMAGSGKTQIAADYARNAWATGKLDLLLWLNADNRTAVLDGYAQAAAYLLGADLEDLGASAEAFLAWLEPKREQRPCRWLIVLDDVSASDDLSPLWPPYSPHGRTLVTSRRRDAALAGQGRRLIGVGPFTQNESVGYLTAALIDVNRYGPAEELAGLAEDLGNLPLALSQAAAYLIDSAYSAADYRRLLANRHVSLSDVAPQFLPDDQHSTVASALALSIERANELRPSGLAAPLLELAAFLGPVIPEAVLTSQPARGYLAQARDLSPRPGHRRDRKASSLGVEQAEAEGVVRALLRLSLVDHDPELPNSPVLVHPLVQRAVRDSLPVLDYAEAACAAADALAAAWPETESDTALDHALRNSAIALVGYAEDELLQPAVHSVMFRAGRSLGQSGQVVEARAYFTHLTDRIASQLGADHPDALAARFERARWSREAGSEAEAATMLSELAGDQLRVLGPDHPDTLATRHELARYMGETGDVTTALGTLQDLLERTVQRLGDDHPDTLRTRRSLAHWQGEAGDPGTAVAVLSDVEYAMRRILGPNHPDVFINHLLLGHWLGEAGNPSQAVDVLAYTHRNMQRVLGDNHPDTLTALSELAQWIREAGSPAEAVAMLTDVVARMERTVGEDHPRTISARDNLAICQGTSGDPSTSGSALAALLSRSIRALGSNRPDTLTAGDTLPPYARMENRTVTTYHRRGEVEVEVEPRARADGPGPR
ncbi:FxSxx-COOH system tetratricopeptide repeat protein [Streptomyces sp. NBC_00038]|uniref:FxSxx-COOH system tetratricopeptide repeat protein n=1 Tax=Streptomyces sp. NBC_00038 TaxID=2903615 RepID=UPI002254AE01|nr:FxSxx-COOH system tetratricopeptide repeat protein [Streptomyces sp. NBC_00038]MCX5559522.1 FxSxx-COOH system tetratricopeptide repeat protein [Streptomyces sp. NBC_00038]